MNLKSETVNFAMSGIHEAYSTTLEKVYISMQFEFHYNTTLNFYVLRVPQI